MTRTHYFFTTFLPALPALGEAPPLSLRELASRAEDWPDLAEVVGAVLLEHDLLQRQSVLLGQPLQGVPAVLTAEQVRGEAPLPEHLQAEHSQAHPIVEDATWQTYFRYVASVARRHGSDFLRRWVGFEVALRNALVLARAKTLRLNPEEYLVATELADEQADVAEAVTRWTAAGDPLSAQRVLDEARWQWLSENGGWFTFQTDEAASYARGLVLSHRWHQMKNNCKL